MSPPTSRRRLGREAASKSSSVVGGGQLHDSRLVAVDPITIRALSAVVPCRLCDDHGLCSRCWVVARAVEQLAVAGRRDQATDLGVAA